MRNQQIFNSFGKLFRKDLVIGGFVGCSLIIGSLATWGFYNQSQWKLCNDDFNNYVRSLQFRTEEMYEKDRKANDSIRKELKIEIEKTRAAKEEVERKLIELKTVHK